VRASAKKVLMRSMMRVDSSRRNGKRQ
jgi:hypothetical protein